MYYDSPKLYRLMEAFRTANLARRDVSSRRQDARREFTKLRNHLEEHWHRSGRALPEGFDKLFETSAQDLALMPQADLDRFGVNRQTLVQFARARDEHARLSKMYEECESRAQACGAALPTLCDFIASQGLPDPRKEYSL